MKTKHQNITLSFPADLTTLLHNRVSSRGISKYVANAVRKALEEDEKNKLKKLEAAYEEANNDQDRLSDINDWKGRDNEDNIEGWEWEE